MDAVERRLGYAGKPLPFAGIVEFPVRYEEFGADALRRLHLAAAFDSVRCSVSYAQSDCFDAFLPAWLVSAAYESVVAALRIEKPAACVGVVARR